MPLAGAEVQPIPPGRLASTWRLPVALVALSLIPVLAGSARLAELAGGPELLPPRFDPSPVPLVVHIVSVIVFAVLGAFQFRGVRALSRSAVAPRRRPLLVVAGMRGGALRAVADARSTPAPRAVTCSTCSGCWPAGACSPAPPARLHSDPPARHRTAPRMDDPRLRPRPRCRYPGVHPRHRGGTSRAQRPQHRPPAGCGLGHQPCCRRMVHPSGPGPSIRRRDRGSPMSRPGRRGQAPARYELRIDGHLDDRWTAGSTT